MTEDNYAYQGWLKSDKFLKRAFAIWGHFMVAHVLIAVSLIVPFLILGAIFSLVSMQ